MSPAPTIGRIVIFRSRTGKYDVPAIITATAATLNPEGVAAYKRSVEARTVFDIAPGCADPEAEREATRKIVEAENPLRGVPPLSSDTHVHLTVFTPGLPGQRANADDFEVQPSTGLLGENVAGCYQEFDVPFDGVLDAHAVAGSWRWPTRA